MRKQFLGILLTFLSFVFIVPAHAGDFSTEVCPICGVNRQGIDELLTASAEADRAIEGLTNEFNDLTALLRSDRSRSPHVRYAPSRQEVANLLADQIKIYFPRPDQTVQCADFQSTHMGSMVCLDSTLFTAATVTVKWRTRHTTTASSYNLYDVDDMRSFLADTASRNPHYLLDALDAARKSPDSVRTLDLLERANKNRLTREDHDLLADDKQVDILFSNLKFQVTMAQAVRQVADRHFNIIADHPDGRHPIRIKYRFSGDVVTVYVPEYMTVENRLVMRSESILFQAEVTPHESFFDDLEVVNDDQARRYVFRLKDSGDIIGHVHYRELFPYLRKDQPGPTIFQGVSLADREDCRVHSTKEDCREDRR